MLSSKGVINLKFLTITLKEPLGVDQKILLGIKEKPSTQGNLQLVLTFNETLPNIENVINTHWHILSTNENLRKVFDKRPFTSCRRNTNLHQLLRGNCTFLKKLVRQNTKHLKQSGYCSSCLSIINKNMNKSKQKHSKVTRQKRPFKYFTTLRAKVKT